MMKIAVVGYGYWGPNLARNLSETKGVELSAICDLRPAMLKQAHSRYPNVNCISSFDDLLKDSRIDALVIATPVSTHADLCIRAFRAGKHVWVEKPLAGSTAEAQMVVEEAERRKRVLLVDHTFVYMGAVHKVKEIIDGGSLGELYYYDSVRVNLGLFQHDVSVIWDLAVHDISIIGYWMAKLPSKVSCTGMAHIHGHPADMAYLTLIYDNSFIAHMHVNWLSPVKIRRTLLGGEKKMIVFNDLDPEEKIKVYDRGVARKEEMVGSGKVPLAYRRTGDIWIPQFDMQEALRVESEHFVRCVTNGERPLTGGREALNVVKILDAAERSMKEHGMAVNL